MDKELKQYLDELSERTTGQFQQMREESAAAHEETRRVLRGEIGELATTLRGEMGEITTTLRGEIAEAVSTLRGEMAAEHAETRRHFDVTVERWESRFDLLAETVQIVDQKVDRQGAEIRQEIALLKFPQPRTRRTKR